MDSGGTEICNNKLVYIQLQPALALEELDFCVGSLLSASSIIADC